MCPVPCFVEKQHKKTLTHGARGTRC